MTISNLNWQQELARMQADFNEKVATVFVPKAQAVVSALESIILVGAEDSSRQEVEFVVALYDVLAESVDDLVDTVTNGCGYVVRQASGGTYYLENQGPHEEYEPGFYEARFAHEFVQSLRQELLGAYTLVEAYRSGGLVQGQLYMSAQQLSARFY